MFLKKREVFNNYNYVLCFCRRLNLECFNKNFDVLINIICKVFILQLKGKCKIML